MEDFDPSFSLSCLLCHEDESCLNDHHGQGGSSFHECCISESDDEYVNNLIQNEASFFQSDSNVSAGDCSIKTDQSWLKCARSDAIQWILNTRAMFGFQFSTAYLSLVYFDRFFAKRSIEDGKMWAIRLLSVACLSLAAKMEECKVPTLSEYHVDEYSFKGNVVQRMELLVLCTLDWKMNLVTPFAYLHYFIIKFCGEYTPKELFSKAIELILTIVKEVNLVEHRPSIIAAAAVLAAYDYQLTRKILEFKMSIISSWGSLEKECILSCYNLLQEKEMLKKSKTPISLICPRSHLPSSICNDVLENPSITSGVGTKRRLALDDCDHDQHFPPTKTHRS